MTNVWPILISFQFLMLAIQLLGVGKMVKDIRDELRKRNEPKPEERGWAGRRERRD